MGIKGLLLTVDRGHVHLEGGGIGGGIGAFQYKALDPYLLPHVALRPLVLQFGKAKGGEQCQKREQETKREHQSLFGTNEKGDQKKQQEYSCRHDLPNAACVRSSHGDKGKEHTRQRQRSVVKDPHFRLPSLIFCWKHTILNIKTIQNDQRN